MEGAPFFSWPLRKKGSSLASSNERASGRLLNIGLAFLSFSSFLCFLACCYFLSFSCRRSGATGNGFLLSEMTVFVETESLFSLSLSLSFRFSPPFFALVYPIRPKLYNSSDRSLRLQVSEEGSRKTIFPISIRWH